MTAENDREDTMDWTPPERHYVYVCAGCGATMTHASRCEPGCASIESQQVECVPADCLAAVERERDEARDDLGQISALLLPDTSPPVQAVEALRDRAAELEAGLRDLWGAGEDAVCDRPTTHRMISALDRARVLLSGGSHEEPRPDTGETCPECDGEGFWWANGGHGAHDWKQRCAPCGGTGRRPDKCPGCGGEGCMVEPDGRLSVDCPRCDGTTRRRDTTSEEDR